MHCPQEPGIWPSPAQTGCRKRTLPTPVTSLRHSIPSSLSLSCFPAVELRSSSCYTRLAEGPGRSPGECWVPRKNSEMFASNIISYTSSKNKHLLVFWRTEAPRSSSVWKYILLWSSSFLWTPNTLCPCRKQDPFVGSVPWKQEPRCNTHMEEGQTGWWGGSSGQQRSAGTDPVMAPSYPQSICWLSWLCPSPPNGWNIHSQSVGDWWWVEYSKLAGAALLEVVNCVLTAPSRREWCWGSSRKTTAVRRNSKEGIK